MTVSPRQSPMCRRREVPMMLNFVLGADGEVGSAVSEVLSDIIKYIILHNLLL